MKVQTNILKLVVPPLTNYDSERIKDDKEAVSWKKALKNSNLYMIVQCYPSFFIYDQNELFSDTSIDNYRLKLKISVDNIEDSFEINLDEFCNIYEIDSTKYSLGFGFNKNQIVVWECELNTDKKRRIIETITPKMVLAYESYGIKNLFINFKNFTKINKYFLHYIGISKSQDSFSRLVVKPHDKRLRILSNENTFKDYNRLTDEIMLLFFEIEPLRIQVVTNNIIDDTLNYDNLISDAEKAFISILNSNYNSIKYKKYPNYNDGLCNDNFSNYRYMLGNPLTLVTNSVSIKGDKFSEYNMMCENADSIIIESDNVKLISNKSEE